MIFILQHVTFTTSILFLFFSILQLNYKKKLALNYFLAGLFFANACIIFYFWSFSVRLLEYFPVLMNIDVAFTYLIGPFFFLYCIQLAGKKKIRSGFLFLCFFPFFAAFIIVLIINFIDPSLYIDHVAKGLFFPDYSMNRIIFIVDSLGDISIVVYFVMSLYQLSIFLKIKKFTYEFKFLFICLLLMLINSVILVIADALQSVILTILSLGLFAVVPMYYIFFSFRYPEFAIRVIKEAESIQYKKSIEKRYDSALIEKRLLQLMEEEKIYTDCDLTLNSLSDMLVISSNELSHILNNRFNKNFNTFVNSYRIEYVKSLLLQYPEMGILEISFSSGFNSKSPFYSYFLKETGMSPKEFRSKKLNHI